MKHSFCLWTLVLAMGISPATAAEPPANLDELIAAAKAEGSVVVDDTTPQADFSKVINAFESKYPFIRVTQSTVGGNEIIVKTQQEVAAKAPSSVDLLLGGFLTGMDMGSKGQLLATNWRAFGLADGAYRNQYEVNGAAVFTVVGYNTDLVKNSDAPKAWDDLLDPKWSGKLAVPVGGWGYTIADLATVWGEPKAEEYTRKIKEHSVLLALPPEVAPRVAAGEYSLGIMRRQHAKRAIARGAPLAIADLDPMPVIATSWQIPATARHPNAARLFAVWISSPDGQSSYEAAAERGNPWLPGSEASKVINGRKVVYFDPRPETVKPRMDQEKRLQSLMEQR